ncbi:transmembrane 220 family protein [Akkermansiaceae bacterium]|nr:transmembrane 220 family protein [Akkermansiaceae bacterium]
MKISCIVATVIFAVFAYFQVNDATQYLNGDFWSWILFYLGTATVSLLVGIEICKSLPLLTGFAGFALGSFLFRMQDEHGNFQFENFTGRDWFADQETGVMKQQTNEAGGLLIVAVWLFILAYMVWRKYKATYKQKA